MCDSIDISWTTMWKHNLKLASRCGAAYSDQSKGVCCKDCVVAYGMVGMLLTWSLAAKAQITGSVATVS